MPRILKGRKENLGLKRRLRSEMTAAELKLWAKIRGEQLQGLKFRRQHGIGPYIVDFYCPSKRFVIELDGDSHGENVQIAKDTRRDAYFRSLGVAVLRYTNEDVLKNVGGVLEDLSGRVSKQRA